MSHTPGPWWRDDDGCVASGSGETYVTVADANCSNDIDIDEREDNTRLIAAAPEMLEALESLVEHLEALEQADRDNVVYLPGCIQRANTTLRAFALEAIRKAKGE